MTRLFIERGALIKALCVIACIAGFSGCASLSGLGGSSSSSCPVPSGVTCKPIGDVYRSPAVQLADAQAVPSPTTSIGNSTSMAQSGFNTAVPSALALTKYEPSSNAVREVPTTGAPVRSSTRLLRIWIAPYEDDEGALLDHRYVHVMIDSGKWKVEANRAALMRSYAATKAPKAGAAAPSSGSNNQPESAAKPSAILQQMQVISGQNSDGKAETE